MNRKRLSTLYPAIIVALTGGIGSGKTTVGHLLRERGFIVLDTDEIARQALEPGKAAFERVKAAFGTGITTPEGHIDRRRLLELILDDLHAKKRLEQIVHPYVLNELQHRIDQLVKGGSKLIIVEVPLLFEANWQDLFDFIICVIAPDELRLKRLTRDRKIPRSLAESWLRAQIPQEEKVKAADYIINNNGSMEELTGKINKLIERLKGLKV